MNAGHLLILFLPDRRRPGTLTTVLRKYPVQYVEGCVEPSVRERYAGMRGVLLTVVDWTPQDVVTPARGAPRVTLPAPIVALLDEVGAAVADDFEVAVIGPDGELRYHAEVGRSRLTRPLAVGCRYEVRR